MKQVVNTILTSFFIYFFGILWPLEDILVGAEPKFPLDFDDTDFYLTSRKGGPPSAVIEDIRRGQEGVLVKLRQVTNELENDELKLNNIFYKLGHHDTELKSISNGIGRLSTTGRRTETKLNKHAFNVEFLHRQVKEMEHKLTEQSEDKVKISGLQKTVDHLEDRLSEALFRLASVENASNAKRQRSKDAQSIDFQYIEQPGALMQYPLSDQRACQNGWVIIDDHCFYVSDEEQTFKKAVSTCVQMGASLVSLTNIKRDIFMRKFSSTDAQYWTSATDIFSPNQWNFLMSGEPVSKEMWTTSFSGYLSSRRADHCALIGRKGLEAVKCGHKKPFICEKL